MYLAMSVQYIDSHAHLFFNDYQSDCEEVIERAKQNDVCAIIVPGTDLDSSRQAVELAERYSEVYAAVGFHPHDALKCAEQDLKELDLLLQHPRVVAIGEIGLDFYYNYSPWDIQKKVLWRQLELAASRNLPVIIHSRDSMTDTLDLLQKFIENFPQWRSSGEKQKRGVFHCFSGSLDDASIVLSLDFFISFTGNVTFKKSTTASVVKEIGFENLLLETDSPYMAPVPYRGKRNEPANIPIIANKIAELCSAPIEEVSRKTYSNTCELFGLSL